MREILFRGKDIAGNWHYGTPLVFTEDYVCITAPHTHNKKVEATTVGQFTGLTDKNGKKIFEGDILNCLTSDFDGSDKYVYNFKITDITNFEHMGFLAFCNEIEVIGNIHDNPELLKGA